MEHWVIEAILQHLQLGHLGYVIHDLLTRSHTQLKYNNQISESKIKIERGTKQGDVISPLLFLLFMAPLLWKIETTCKGVSINGIQMKAGAIMDDVVLTTDDTSDAIKMINTVFEWSEITGININPKKSAYVYKNISNTYLPMWKGKKFEDLGDTKSYKYLGVWINLNLAWKDKQSKLLEAAYAIFGRITRKFYLTPYLMCKLINATKYAKIGYRMQVVIFHRDWINKVERAI